MFRMIRKFGAILGSVLLGGLLLQSASAAPARERAGGTTKSRELVVGEDATGDWGGNPVSAPIGSSAGQDLVRALIGEPERGKVAFTIEVTDLTSPQWTSSHYSWHFTITGKVDDDVYYQLLRPWPADADDFSIDLQQCTPDSVYVGSGEVSNPQCDVVAEAALDVDEQKGRLVMTVPRSALGGKAVRAIDARGEILANMPPGSFDVQEQGNQDWLVTDKAYVLKKLTRHRKR